MTTIRRSQLLSGLHLKPLYITLTSKSTGIKRIFIKNADFYISRGKKRRHITHFHKMRVKNLNLNLTAKRNKFDLDIDSKSFSVYFDKKKNPFLSNLSFNINSTIFKNHIEVRTFHVSEFNDKNYFINISGILSDIDSLLKIKNINLSLEMNWKLNHLSKLSEMLLNRKYLPLSGIINSDVIIRFKNRKTQYFI